MVELENGLHFALLTVVEHNMDAIAELIRQRLKIPTRANAAQSAVRGQNLMHRESGGAGPGASGSGDARPRQRRRPAMPGRNRKVSGTMANATAAEIVNTSQ